MRLKFVKIYTIAISLLGVRGIMQKETIETNSAKIKRLTMLALFFAVAVVLSFIESSFPPIPFFPPGVKLGLSNIAVMYSLFFLGKREAAYIIVLKALFVFLIRGATAGFLSFSGGLFSFIVMTVIMFLFKEHVSYLVLSIFGALFHNIGQFVAISIIFGSLTLLAYLPFLIVMGVFAGVATATILRFILPVLKNVLR